MGGQECMEGSVLWNFKGNYIFFLGGERTIFTISQIQDSHLYSMFCQSEKGRVEGETALAHTKGLTNKSSTFPR